jgi:hypothetical protein
MNDEQYEYLYHRGFNLGFLSGRYEPDTYKDILAKAPNRDWPFYKGMVAGNRAQMDPGIQQALNKHNEANKKKSFRMR